MISYNMISSYDTYLLPGRTYLHICIFSNTATAALYTAVHQHNLQFTVVLQPPMMVEL